MPPGAFPCGVLHQPVDGPRQTGGPRARPLPMGGPARPLPLARPHRRDPRPGRGTARHGLRRERRHRRGRPRAGRAVRQPRAGRRGPGAPGVVPLARRLRRGTRARARQRGRGRLRGHVLLDAGRPGLPQQPAGARRGAGVLRAAGDQPGADRPALLPPGHRAGRPGRRRRRDHVLPRRLLARLAGRPRPALPRRAARDRRGRGRLRAQRGQRRPERRAAARGGRALRPAEGPGLRAGRRRPGGVPQGGRQRQVLHDGGAAGAARLNPARTAPGDPRHPGGAPGTVEPGTWQDRGHDSR
ncbi:hypothetical protein SCOCK_320019 [Actinacidiphila cocklensis]|uniref:Uncharacterized protein n=1 Tax=Actinacidiphila cocklensis TaxID=887465 RepID=A0A9W4DSG2_9ACTN|nr:hypothetical protein SCOCK_320019 [Actinacidiphila cocklensis]